MPIERRHDFWNVRVDWKRGQHEQASGVSTTGAGSIGAGFGKSDRAAHTRATEAAVAAGILREILLVVILGVVKVWGRQDFGGDATVSGPIELLLKHLARRFRGTVLRFVVVVDPRAVLRADVVALTHPLGWIVV